MPEMHFLVRWPDNSVQRCYSPSLVIADYLEPGESYQVEQLIDRCTEALGIASERVRAKYGFVCTAAAQQLHELRDKAVGFQSADVVMVEGFER